VIFLKVEAIKLFDFSDFIITGMLLILSSCYHGPHLAFSSVVIS